ncbi:CHAT domain-containing protein [Streptomyces pseudoechinosporeus]
MVRLPGLAEEGLSAARGWVAELTLLDSPAAVHERVRRTHPGLRVTGTLALLHSVRDGMARGDETGPPVQGAGELLLTVLATSDGEKGWRAAQGIVHGWDLFKAHGHFIVGAAQPPTARWQAHRAYRLAADEYAAGRSGRARGLAVLASFAAAVAGSDAGGTKDVRPAFDRLAEVEPEAAAELERALAETGKILGAGRASAVRKHSARTDTADREDVVGGSAAGPPGRTTLERAEHLQKEALRLADSLERAVERAREADRLLAGLDRPPTAMTALVGELTRREAWRDALRVLDDQHRAAPQDKEIVHRMARCHAQLGDWPKARELLTELMGYRAGKRVGIQHMATLQVLCDLAVALGHDHGPEWEKWVKELEVGVPFTAMFEGGPERRTPRKPRTAVHMERRGADGYLGFNPGVDFRALSEKEHQAHLMAAIAAWLPERERAGLLRDFAKRDPDGTAEVASLAKRNVAEEHFRRGERHFEAGRLDQAQREYETAIEQDPDHADAWCCLGVVLRYRGQHHLAQAHSEESLAIEPTAHGHGLLAQCLLSTGAGPRRAREQFAKALELDPAEGLIREALAKLDEQQPAWPFSRPGSLDATPDRQDYILGLAMFLGPVAPVDPSRRPSAPPPDLAGCGDALLAAVRNNEPGGFVHVADDELRAAAWIAAADPHRLVRATLQAYFIAEHYRHKDRDVDRWKLWTQRMLRLAQALPEDLAPHPSRLGLGRDRLLAYAFSAVADVRIADHQLPEAQACLQRARDLLLADEAERRRTGEGVAEYDRLFAPRSVLASMLRRLATVCRRLGDRMAALTYAHEAQRAQEDRPTTRTEVEKYVAAGRRALRQGKSDFGMGAFQEAVRLAEDENPHLIVPVTQINAIVALGRARHVMGMHRSALACFARARQLEEQTGMSRRATGCHLDIARVLRARPDIAEALGGDARHHAEQELLLASVRDETGAGGGDPLCWTASDGVRYRVTKAEEAGPALLELAGLLEESGEDDTAVRLLMMVTHVADLLRANAADADQRIAIQNEQIGSFAELTRIHFRRADGDGDADAFRQAWAAHEAMRARTFLDALGEAELTMPTDVPAGLVRREAALLARRAGLRAWTGERSPEFWESYREVQGELDDIWAAIRQEAPAAAAYVEVRQGRPADPDHIAKTLRILANGRTVVLASLVLLDDRRLGVIALRSDGSSPRIRSLPTDVGELARFVRQNFGASDRVRPLAADMEDLFQHQLAPVADLLASVSDPEDVLLVCPTGFLHHVPLGAVNTGGRTLLERNPVSLLPSGSFLRVVGSARSGSADRHAEVFGDPTGDLHGTRAEALRLAAEFGVRPVLGRDATVSAVLDALTRTSVLHVAGHARFDATDPLDSGLVLADGLLTARDIIQLRAPDLSLVTLSACETGVSATDDADELAGLTRALLFAGADSMLVSLWKVPDGPTAEIMGAFYDGIGRRGLSRTDALREAVLTARENNGRNRFDRWAGFQLIGDWR